MSDLSSWDSTEEEDQILEPGSHQQFSLGMKHSEGMMDLSKVLLEQPLPEEKVSKEHDVLSKMENMNEERIYDSVDNLITEDKEPIIKMLEKKKSTTEMGDNNYKCFLDRQGPIEMKNNRLANNDLRDTLSPHSNSYTREVALESNINPYTKHPEYEKELHQPQDQTKLIDASDWDSPPLSEDKEIAIPKRVSPFMNINTGESTSASGRKQTSLIVPASNRCIPKQHVAQLDQLSSTSLIKFKEAYQDDDDTFARVSGDNQPYSSLPTDATKQDFNDQLYNQNRYEGLNKIISVTSGGRFRLNKLF